MRRRSREGAWIEIDVLLNAATAKNVAPVRERGLKFQRKRFKQIVASRSREGAWIEIITGGTLTGPGYESLP